MEDFIQIEFDIGRVPSVKKAASIFDQKYLIFVDKGFALDDHSRPVPSALCEHCSHLFDCNVFSSFSAHL